MRHEADQTAIQLLVGTGDGTGGRQMEARSSVAPAERNQAVQRNQAQVGGTSQKMLTLQLRELEAAGLLTRTVYPVIRPMWNILLTERGMELAPVLRGLCAWSGKNTPWRRALRLPAAAPLGTERDLPGAAESFPEA